MERPVCDCKYAIGRRACRSFHCVRLYSGTERVNSYPFLFGTTAPQWARVSASLNDAPHSVGLLWTSDQLVAQICT